MAGVLAGSLNYPYQVLPVDVWQAAAADHLARATVFTAERLARASRGVQHPVWDFLFDYYMISPAALRRWHPGIRYRLAGDAEHQSWRDYHSDAESATIGVDVAGFSAATVASWRSVRKLLVATAAAKPVFHCFGLHEWAMVYQQPQHRHDLPLRIGQQATDTVVERSALCCTHVDAVRFFTPAALPRNAYHPARDTQAEFEQAGCVHATMDLYKWAGKLGAIIPGELLHRCFALACRARILDMEASPYDCRSLGFQVVPIETAAGRAEYVRRQRELAAAGSRLRQQLVEHIDLALAARKSIAAH
ncbi:3-methyladenine DNA glycosylase [Corynebacterium choanae]|uniref:3-methyladenine DNA glycosylase n=1 Tax=Corynebacterium choanae TaxID=1862358 RepID=A0A3G6J6E6_9CORY|nr:3-methyladenine DNA glycosylase [Corynebacterium choanae]AZA13509.1 hypothetical protein CCHOA_05545 [Corynebacterium choanae]